LSEPVSAGACGALSFLTSSSAPACSRQDISRRGRLQLKICLLLQTDTEDSLGQHTLCLYPTNKEQFSPIPCATIVTNISPTRHT
jgi:hypothetical protein